MKRITLFIFVLLSALSAAAQLQVKELTLRNGMTVWLNEDHSQPRVFGAVVVRAGAKDCPNTGIAHYFEHIMFKGTDRLGTIDYAQERPWLDSISAQYDLLSQTRDDSQRGLIQQHINELSLRAADFAIPNEFNRLISRYGGSGLNAGTTYDETFYYNSFLPQYIHQWCVLNSERLMRPVFRGFQGELENVYEEKNRSADITGNALETITGTLFKQQPYAYPIIGSTESLKNPRLSDMESFFRSYYVAPNMGLILCGDITADSTLTALLEQTFGRVQTGPVPVRATSPMPAIAAGERAEVRLPIPIVSIEALVFKAPTDFEPDADALDVVNQLLSNGKAGLLDSLMNEHRVLAAGAQSMSLADAAGTAIFLVPKLLGKTKKAEAACMEQVRRIMAGEFTAEQLEQQKRELLMDAERQLETIDGRSKLLIDLYSRGYTWQDMLDKIERIRRVSRADVMAAATKYYGANYVTFSKKFGTPDKEKLSQPGYKPIAPKNADAKSELARELEQLPVADADIRLVDFDRDVCTRSLSPHVTLCCKENPVNDIFSLVVRYRDGSLHTPVLTALATYLGLVGTDSLAKHQLEQAWQRLGVSMEVSCGQRTFNFRLTGRDDQLQPALQLLAHFLGSAKADREALDDMKSENKIDRKSFGKQKDNVFEAVEEYVTYGQRSHFLTQLSKADMKRLKADDLLRALRELLRYDCDVFYCGRQTADAVADAALRALPLSECQLPMADTYRRVQQYQEPTVFFYDVPKSRQNYVMSYDWLPALPTAGERVAQQLWARYFGGGMSSVLFQNVREYRSLAYSTHGYTVSPSLALHAQEPLAYITRTGTQADKTVQALTVVDSLLRRLPMKEENLRASRQELLNNVQNGYPTFRDLMFYVGNHRLSGYTSDPHAATVQVAPTLTAADVQQFHERHVAPNPNRVWVVVGDKRLTPPESLSTFGRVVELRKEDVFR